MMRRRSELGGRRGNVAVTAMSLTALLGMGALAVDVAWVRVVDAQLEAALDAGAAGGAGYLDGTVIGVETAIAKAVAIAELNPVAVPMQIGPEHVMPGDWDPETRTFTAMPVFDDETAQQIDAIRIDLRLEGIPAILAGAAFGVPSLRTNSASIAHRPLNPVAREVDCYLPLALPSCMFPSDPTVNPPPMEVNMGDNLADTVGWALPGGVNAADLKQHLVDGCGDGSLSVNDEVDVQNGIVASQVQTVGKVLNGWQGAADVWDTELMGPVPDRGDPAAAFPSADSLVTFANWGNVIEGPIALVDLGGAPGTCEGAAAFNGTHPVEGFTWGMLYDARAGNASTSGFMLQLDFVNERELGTLGAAEGLGNVTAPPGPVFLVL